MKRSWAVFLVLGMASLSADPPPPLPVVGPSSQPDPGTGPTPLPVTAPPVAVVAPQSTALPPGAKPVQLQFIAPDTVQEDLAGAVKSVDEKSSDRTMRSIRFDRNGCYTEEARTKYDVPSDHETMVYDTQGNLISVQVLTDPELAGAVCTNEYDAQHRKVTSTYKMADGTIRKTKVTFYDGSGKEHEVIELDNTGKVTKRTVLTRDNRGHETSVVFYGQDNQPKDTITIAWNPDGTPASETFSGDEAGNSVEWTYDYLSKDEQGNWTARNRHIVVQHDLQTVRETTVSTERTIEYY